MLTAAMQPPPIACLPCVPLQATRAYLHKEDDVEAALARAGKG